MSQNQAEGKPKENALDRVIDWVSRFMILICVLLFSVMVFSVSYGVIGRYIPFIRNPRWTQELAILCMVWLCFVSAGDAIKNGLLSDIFNCSF